MVCRLEQILENQIRINVRTALEASDADTLDSTCIECVSDRHTERTLPVSRGLRLSSLFRSSGTLCLWNVYQTLGIKTVFLIPASARSKAHWGIWNFVCWLLYALNHSLLERIGISANGYLKGQELLQPQGNRALQCNCLPKWTLFSSYFSLPSYHITEHLYLRTLRATHPMFSRDGRVYAEKYRRVNSI